MINTVRDKESDRDEGLCTACLYSSKPYVADDKCAEVDVIFIGESPGADEIRVGRPFVGASGKLIRSALETLNITSFAFTNAFPCATKEFDFDQAEACYRSRHPLKMCAPTKVVALGRIAEELLDRIHDIFPIAEFKFVYHPAYCLRGGITRSKWKKHLEDAL